MLQDDGVAETPQTFYDAVGGAETFRAIVSRFYELVSVYGTTFKALINEEYGDGIMSAIDFDMDMSRLPHEKGDRVKIVMSGKYLQYKTY